MARCVPTCRRKRARATRCACATPRASGSGSSSRSMAATSSMAANRTSRVPNPCTCSHLMKPRTTPAGAPISTRSTSSISPTGAIRTPKPSATAPRAASSPSRCTARCRRLAPCTNRMTNANAAPIRPARRCRACRGEVRCRRDESAGTGYGDRRVDHAVQVEFVAHSSADSRHFIKYEWRETLCRKHLHRVRREESVLG